MLVKASKQSAKAVHNSLRKQYTPDPPIEAREATDETVASEAREAVEAAAAMPPMLLLSALIVTRPSATFHSSWQRAEVNSAGRKGGKKEGEGEMGDKV